jgi:hypothetical protein
MVGVVGRVVSFVVGYFASLFFLERQNKGNQVI